MTDPFDFDGVPEPVPAAFHSFETEGPFESCCVCGRSLADEVLHLIEKAFLRGETIYEYAICQECHSGIREELSQESKQRVEGFLRTRIQNRNLAGDPLERCLFSDEPLGDEYLICGLFLGRSMLPNFPPFAISAQELEKLQELLSKTTRERLDEFTEDVLGVPGLGNPVPVMM